MTRFIYLCGADGTGKSTQAERLLADFSKEGARPVHRWLRYPYFLGLVFLGYARLRKFSWVEELNGVRRGHWDFRNSWLLRNVLPWVLLVDIALQAALRIYWPLLCGRTVVCERFVYDVLVDLAVAYDEPTLHRRLPFKLYPRVLPQSAVTVNLDLGTKRIRARRSELKHDRRLEARLQVFRQLAADYYLPVVSSDPSIEGVYDQIRTILDARSTPLPSSGYGKFRSKTMRKLLRYPLTAILMHWVFQGLLYMDPSERRFKLGLDLVLTLVGGFLLMPIFPPFAAWFLAFLIAHTVNFLVNGQLWGVLKHYGGVTSSSHAFWSYVDSFQQRAAKEPSIREIVVYGSLSRQELYKQFEELPVCKQFEELPWSPSSDFDARLIRYPGFRNGLRACWFLLQERLRAFILRFPIDVYVLDEKRLTTNEAYLAD